MLRFLLGPFIWLLLVVASPTEAADPDEIIVNAPSVDPAMLRKQVTEFSKAISDTAGQEQFSRREDAYCAKVMGLAPRYEAIVLEKYTAAAAATGKMKRAKEVCQTDILIIFTEDADGLANALRTKNAAIFARLSKEKAAEIFNSHRAVRWWYGTEMQGAQGEPMIDGTLYRTQSSLISSGIRISLTTTVVLVDVTKSSGYPLDSIASFSAMVSFAQIRGHQQRFANLPSILGIFDREGPKLDAYRDLTVWDRAYLQAIYHIPPDRPLWQQRNRLIGAMTDALDARGK